MKPSDPRSFASLARAMNVSNLPVRTTLRSLLHLVQTFAAVLMLIGAQFGFAATSAPGPTSQFPPRLTVGVLAAGWAPFEVQKGGRLTGLSADYLRALVGPDVIIEPKVFPDMPQLLAAASAGKVDLLMSISRTPEREHNLNFTAPYFRASTSVVVNVHDTAFQDAAARLGDARIAIENGFALERMLRERYPRAQIETFVDTASALVAVEHGAADAYLGFTPALNSALGSKAYADLRVAYEDVSRPSELRFAVASNRKALRDQLDRALESMSTSEEATIRKRWLGESGDSPSPVAARRVLTLTEKQPVRQEWATGNSGESGVWSVTAVRLLPLLIGIGVVLVVTLRAYLLLQREVKLRKQTERALASQLNFQQTMMETVPYPLVAKDLDGRYLAINRAYEVCSGLRREQVVGQTADAVQAWGPVNSRRLEEVTREVVESGERSQVELEFKGRFDEPRQGLFWTSLCLGVDGKPSCVLGTMVDITDIRHAEWLAGENERRLFDVTGSLPAVVFQLRRDANGSYSFPYIGGDTRLLLGGNGSKTTSPSELSIDRVCAEDRPRVLTELEASARSGTPIQMEFRSDGPGGLKWVRAGLVPRREELAGSVVWSGYWVDASADRARADELARARDIAEAASRAKDDFLAMMSHEIRTPMNGVLGLVEVLERTRLNADQGEMLGMIHESAGALLQILDDLLDYSKIEAGRLTIEAEPIDMRDLVDNAVGLLAGRAHEKGLKVRVDIAPEVAASLRGDSVRLRQILFNLLGNAIKFTTAGEVDVGVDVVKQTPHVQILEMTVKDTGIGIAPDVQARLFEPFVQAESSTTRRFGGTGLGLTICRKLVALMGGTLELESALGLGTSMTVRLEMPVETQRFQANGLRGKRGLVAVSDVRIGNALVHFGAALGIDLRRVAPGAAELSDPAALADMDLIFLSEELALPCSTASAPRLICLTEKPKPTGYRIVDDTVRVSINPISWRGLGAACAAALTGLPPVPLRTHETAEAGVAPPDRARAIASGRLILVAEDHPVNQELIRHQLALLGFACDVVSDGVEALAALKDTSYCCLITDCHMPKLSGYELVRRVREMEEANPTGAQSLPILGITANTAPEDLAQCRDAGMDDCLVKPTRLATLRDHLSRWFGADGTRQGAQAEQANQPPINEAPATEFAEAFVPVDLGHMIQLWGSESTVKALLASFVTSVRDDVKALPPLLDEANVGQLREWHHRIAGAAGVLQYPPLLAELERYRCSITANPPARRRDDGLMLARKCNAMLDGIEEQAALLA